MRPGDACISCHQSSDEAPLYTFMGTVFSNPAEPTGCEGVGGGIEVIVTDVSGNQLSMLTNSAGNFMGTPSGPFTMPFTAKVLYQGRENDMVLPQSTGDCNSCHTETGIGGAPGRILAP